MQFLWRYIDELVGKGLDSGVIAELLLYVSTTLVPMALPLAVLLASIMTFGNLGENYELIALKASGISLFKIMKPLVWLTIFMTIFAFFFSNNVLPVANLKAGVLLHDIKQQKPELSIKEGVFTNLEGYSIKVASIEKETGMMHDLIIYNHSKKKDVKGEVTVADSGKIIVDEKRGVTEFILFSGSVYTEMENKDRRRKTYPFRRVHYGEQRMSISMADDDLKRSDENLYSRSSSRMLNIKQISHAKDSMEIAFAKKQENFSEQRLNRDFYRNSPRRFRKVRKPRNKENIKNPKALVDKKEIALEVEKEPEIKGVLKADSLFKMMPIESKVRAIKRSIEYARRVNSAIQMEKGQFATKAELIRRYEIEWHKKFTLSFACLIFFFIGAPLGSIIRKGGLGTPVVISVVFFIIYYIISMIGERSAREGVMDPWQGMWLSSALILPLGVLLTWKAVTDSEIMNSDLYINFFRKFGLYKEKKEKKEEDKENIIALNQ
jgi:lipopolysaccharide export system permease protein